MKNETELNAMSSADLASYFNGLTGSKVSRFATKGAGIKRILAAQADLNSGKKPKAVKPKKAKAPKKAAPTPAPVAPSDDSKLPRASTVYVQKAGSKSWTAYRSVLVAFVGLDLPVGVHQGFRKDLKIEGEQVMGEYTFQSRDKHCGVA